MTEPSAPTILVVYDSKSIRETVSILAGDAAYALVELDTPDTILSTIDAADPDLVILCAMTQSTFAFRVCAEIKEARQAEYVPVIIYSLRNERKDRDTAFTAGADITVQVTISPEDLHDHIRSLLRTRQVMKRTTERCHSLARAGAEAAKMMLNLEEAGRRIQEQNERIRQQQTEIETHLTTMRTEIDLAVQLQVNMLPQACPQDQSLSAANRYIPAADLGGDYYDYVTSSGGRFYTSIADVTGHGVASALVGVQVRTMGRAAALEGKSPAEILTRLNHFMCETFQQSYLLTMFIIACDPGSREMVVSGAGHCPLILLAANKQSCCEIYSKGMPLGVSLQASFTDARVKLAKGDRLLCYTDGITEANDKAGEEFGAVRLLATLTENRSQSGEGILSACLGAAKAFSMTEIFDDDVTLVLLERS